MKEKQQPIEPHLRKIMNDIGKTLANTINEVGEGKYGFCLFVFNFGEKGRINYISNAQREDMVATLKEFIANVESEFPDSFTKKKKTQ